MPAKGHKGTFWGDRNILDFDRGVVYTCIYIYQNSSNYILNLLSLYILLEHKKERCDSLCVTRPVAGPQSLA